MPEAATDLKVAGESDGFRREKSGSESASIS
jgi:hypothetical protein